MKINQKLFLQYILPLVAWITLIHFSSSQSYEGQNVQPLLEGFPLEWVNKLFYWVSITYGDSVVSLETRTPEAFVEFFLRKGAHLFVYAVLGIIAYRLLNQVLHQTVLSGLIAWVFTTAYAGVDELRQYFHPNRSGMIEDVILDSVGGAIGITVWVYWQHRKEKRGS